MRSKFLIVALPALLLGLAACDDHNAQNSNAANQTSPTTSSGSSRESTTVPPPSTGVPVQGGTSGNSMNESSGATRTLPGGSTAGGSAGGGASTGGSATPSGSQ